jgi:hypothetical protein
VANSASNMMSVLFGSCGLALRRWGLKTDVASDVILEAHWRIHDGVLRAARRARALDGVSSRCPTCSCRTWSG